MIIRKITENKKKYLSLLLLGDEDERMIDRYLDAGEMFLLEDDAGFPVGECVVCVRDESAEIMNLAVSPEEQRRGHGSRLVRFAEDYCRGRGCRELLVGTGESPLTLPFYKACGFAEYKRIPGFFTEHYDHEIIEAGVVLTDMIVLRKPIGQGEHENGV